MAQPNHHIAQAQLAYRSSFVDLPSSFAISQATAVLASSALPSTSSASVSASTFFQSLQVDDPTSLYLKPSNRPEQAESTAQLPTTKGRKGSAALSGVLSYLTGISFHYSVGDSRSISEVHGNPTEPATSSSWLNRKTCRWFGGCGVPTLEDSAWASLADSVKDEEGLQDEVEVPSSSAYWSSGYDDPQDWSHQDRIDREIPSYVYEYTPYVHLFSGEDFWPCDIANHLNHTTPYQNYTPIQDLEQDITLDNLDDLNRYGRFTYLQSNDNVEERPNWLGGSNNIPSSAEGLERSKGQTKPPRPLLGGLLRGSDRKAWYNVGVGDIKGHNGIRPNPTTDPNSRHPTMPVLTPEQETEAIRAMSKRSVNQTGGHSSAPALLIVVPKPHGVVDAFWFYFYSFNLGNQVLNVRFGNHVGDWEHSVVRFQHGVPKAVFISEHNFGEAYTYEAMEKIGKRPVIYSAVGTHAMYATPGLHPYVLPWGLLHDETDRGPLWDPVLNHHGFVYNYTSGVIRSSTQTPKAPIGWFNYFGSWGDKIYPMSDPRQYKFAGQYHYVTGPLGPKFKNLGRKTICQGNKECVIREWLGGGRIRRWPGSRAESEAEEDPL